MSMGRHSMHRRTALCHPQQSMYGAMHVRNNFTVIENSIIQSLDLLQLQNKAQTFKLANYVYSALGLYVEHATLAYVYSFITETHTIYIRTQFYCTHTYSH